MEQELIKIETRDGRQVVSARELFEKLITSQGKQERFSQWFNRHLKYGFEKGIDFMESKKIYTANQYGGEKELEDYVITIDMAKELCMLQKSEIGREFRKYFIECEKQLKEVKQKQDSYTIQNPIERAKRWIEEQEEKLRLEAENKILDEQVKQLSPLAETLIKRFEKGENISLTDVTKTFGLKRGQVSKWAIKQGLIYKNKKDVTNKGDEYFQRYVYNGFKNICITPKGVQLIEEHLEEIKAL